MASTNKKPLPTLKHLKWLVESRRQNQEVSTHLYGLLTPKCWNNPTLGYQAKTLVSIGFSLWRAAFLADKSKYLEDTNEHAIYFLGEMLDTNLINFTQDKNAKSFTFNYYLANVRFRLAEFKDDNHDFEVDKRLLKRGKLNKVSPPKRWRAYQKAFKHAVKHFEARL